MTGPELKAMRIKAGFNLRTMANTLEDTINSVYCLERRKETIEKDTVRIYLKALRKKIVQDTQEILMEIEELLTDEFDSKTIIGTSEWAGWE